MPRLTDDERAELRSAIKSYLSAQQDVDDLLDQDVMATGDVERLRRADAVLQTAHVRYRDLFSAAMAKATGAD